MNIKLIFLSVIFLAASVDAAVIFTPDNDEFRYTGRWDQSNPTQPWAYAKGTSIIVGFQGSSLSGTFSATSTDYLRIIIDDMPSKSIPEKIQISSSNITYTLASGLSPGDHKIEIVKETDAGRWTFHGFVLENGNDINKVPPPQPVRRLVFYGDSNLAGYSLAHEQNQSGQNLRGSYYGFAGIVSRMFNAEYSNISRSGASISSLHASYDRIDWFTPGLLWDFAIDPPDAVIINIGANDVGRPKRKIKNDYHALLDAMRASYPTAHIMMYNAWGWDYNEPANYIHEVIAERDDENMSSAIFPWIFEQWHGCEYDHSGMAHVLAEHLGPILGWTPDDADVMNGYGIGRDVANGGFEEEAPFGGYGWRYYTDDGVSREYDEDADNHYLRLSNGAASHQPKPAAEGETFTVTVWMRGLNESDEVDMTIDFRDQEMWTDPLDSFSETKILSTTWQEYTMSATAPTGTPNPVFHTRLTFQAEPGSTVDIDDVAMSLDVVSDVCTDNDDDGYGVSGSGGPCTNGSAMDCDDDNASINPGALENCSNGIDDDCDMQVDDNDLECKGCAGLGESCVSNSDCCLESCSKGKPSSRVCQ